ncbi:hypothetical protein MINTM005_12860 [Mycobacterium intracellulare]|uniref:hypothetical protein n=1 Tax=Mycobacterium intracellulare TaxID=1767 RepID=UPI0019262F97|nr:hypothetical protein [Mycobacterium intracellulare]BCO56042.1 hypothetical protein MINTM005_12860 [Mycobacterium intracellulare]
MWNPFRRGRRENPAEEQHRQQVEEARQRLVDEYRRLNREQVRREQMLDRMAAVERHRERLMDVERHRSLGIGFSPYATHGQPFRMGQGEVLRRFLAGETSHLRSDEIRSATFSEYKGELRIPGSGWQLVYRLRPDLYILSMDIPMLENSRSAKRWRERVMAAAAEVGAKVLPVSERAYRRAVYSGRGEPDFSSTELIDSNKDYEAVFSIGGRYFLSGYDTQETPPLYFLCELPHKVDTVDEAREALKPESVKAAMAQGLLVERQGDIFAIASDLTDARIVEMGGEIFTQPTPIYGTAHTATRTARMSNGIMLAYGQLRHQPRIIGEDRRPDHGPRRLTGAGWWWLSRNTVPVTGGKRRRQNHPPTSGVDAMVSAEALRQQVRGILGYRF